MTPSQLLDRVRALGTVEEKYIDRIQQQIDDPNKTVKPKAVLSYLVKKDQISKAQAAELLKPPTEDEMVVNQPQENDYDTGALIGDPTSDEPEPTPAEKPPVMEVEPELEADPVIVDPEPVPATDLPPVGQDAFLNDPMAGGGLTDFDQVATAQPANGDDKHASFSGKRDQKDQFKTNWLYIAFGLLGVLLIGVALLYIVNMGRTPDEMMDAAMDSHSRGAWGDATAKFENFLEVYPSHEKAPVARARLVQSILRGKFSAKQYGETISQAENLLQPLSEEEDTQIGLIRDDVGLLLPQSLEFLSASAVERLINDDASDNIPELESELSKLEEYQAIIDNPNFVPTSLKRSTRVRNHLANSTNNIQTIRGQIEKEKLYNSTLQEITQLREESKTDAAFEAYRRLTQKYGDVAAREPLQKLMLTISAKESELVKAVQLQFTPQQSPRPSVIDSTIVMSVTTGEEMTALKEEVIPMLVDGVVYGFDAGTGAIAWRHHVGYQTLNPPTTLDADRTLISDQLNQDLICVTTANGELQWRIEIGEPFKTPSVGDAMVLVSTESGKVIALDPANGQFINAAQLPQSTGASGILGARDPYIYQVGLYSNVYVISSQTFQCEEVYSLGHFKGAVAIAPYQWMGFILIAVNGSDYCDLHVLKAEENGLGLKRIQYIPRILDAVVTSQFTKAVRSLLMMGYNGNIQMLDIDPTNETTPIQAITKLNFGDDRGAQPIIAADGSDIWQAGMGVLHARIKRNQGTIARDNSVEARDRFISQLHPIDEHVMHVRRRAESGMISVTLANGETLKPVWRTDFAGALAGAPHRQGDSLLAISNQGDIYTVPTDTSGNMFLNEPVRASTVVENLQFQHVVELPGDRLAATGPDQRSDLIHYDGNELKLLILSPPADRPTSGPLVMGEDLLLPSGSGHVARVNPKTGALVGSPFQPPIAPNSEFDWLKPIRITDEQFAVASGASKTDPSKLYLLTIANSSKVDPVSELESPEPFKNQLASDGDSIYAILSGSGTDKLASFTAGSPLTAQKSVELKASCDAGPWLNEAGLLVKVADERLYCFDKSLNQKWSWEIGNQQFAGEPEIINGQLMLCFQNGKVVLLSPADGTVVGEFDLHQPIVHRPLRDGNKFYFAGMDGTLHIVDVQQLSK